MKKGLLIAGGLSLIGFALYRFYSKQVEFLQNITYKIVTFKIDKLTADSMSVDFVFQIFNASNVTATVTEMYLDFIINNTVVGNITEVKDIEIIANNSSLVSFKVTLNPKKILGNIVNIVTSSIASMDEKVIVNGYAKIKSGFIKTTLPFEYEKSLSDLLNKK